MKMKYIVRLAALLLSFNLLGQPGFPGPIMPAPPSQSVQELINRANALLSQATQNGSFSAEQLAAIQHVMQQMTTLHLNTVDSQKAMENALKGMLAGLDPHSSFMNPEEFKKFKEDMADGNFGGVGMLLKKKELGEYQKVSLPIPGTPAKIAGILADDEIQAVNGEDTRGMDAVTVVKKLRGAEGSEVEIKVSRKEPGGATKEFTVNLVRAKIFVPNLTYRMRENGIGYIYLSSFNEDSYEKVKTALADLRRKGMRALIFDVRGNPGGYLHVVGPITALFLESGTTVVTAQGRNPNNTYRYPTDIQDLEPEAGTYKNLPLAVLINGGSASASEILAGAVKDLNRGEVLGSKSYGKTTVQTIISFDPKDGPDKARLAAAFPALAGSSLRITIQEFHTPSGKAIPREGLTPTIEVPLNEKTPGEVMTQVYNDHMGLRTSVRVTDPVIEKASEVLSRR